MGFPHRHPGGNHQKNLSLLLQESQTSSKKMSGRDSATKSMDNIRRKMQTMKVEKENTSDKVETLDAKVRAVEDTIELRNEEIMKLEKRLAQVTEDLETATFNLSTANRDLEEYDKINREAELEISSLQRQVANKEESVDNTEARILLAQEKFAEASEAREDYERQRKVLESRCNLDGERIKKLEQQLAEAQLIAEDSDKKYDIVSMKLAKFEAETERADDRLSDDQSRIT